MVYGIPIMIPIYGCIWYTYYTPGLLGACLIGNWAPATGSIGTRQYGEEPRIGTMINTMILLMITENNLK